MSKQPIPRFDVPRDYDRDRLIEELRSRFVVEVGSRKESDEVYYDTFDWRLFKRNAVLYRNGRALCLRTLRDRIPYIVGEATSHLAFVQDLSPGPLRDALERVVNVRALLRLFALHAQTTPIAILDVLQNPVARVIYEELWLTDSSPAAPFSRHLWLEAVRGHDRSAIAISGWLAAAGFRRIDEDVATLALRALGRRPGDYTTHPDVALVPEMRADAAVKMILRFFLDNVIHRNEEGIRNDIDTEFLHEYRVAIRRTRSALGQLKGVFPEVEIEEFKAGFTKIGRVTGPLRDLDVYLLEKEDYQSRLPMALRDGVNRLFEHIRNLRQEAWREVVSHLSSQEYATLMDRWSGFLGRQPAELPAETNAAVPIIELARRRIWKKYRRVVKAGRVIDGRSPDESLHQLRIECKKLRYLLEFFEPVFPENALGGAVKQLKKLQDHLGRFQDLCVQQEFLEKYAAGVALESSDAKQSILAVGCLIGSLAGEKRSVRQSFRRTFVRFASAPNRKLYRRLFKSPVNPGPSPSGRQNQ